MTRAVLVSSVGSFVLSVVLGASTRNGFIAALVAAIATILLNGGVKLSIDRKPSRKASDDLDQYDLNKWQN